MPKLIFLFTIITFSLAPHMSNSETYQIKDKSEPTFERKPLPRPLILTQQLLKEQVQKKRQPNMHTAAKYVKEGNYSSALLELNPLAREGIADAQALLGYMHLHGMGTRRDNETAFFWLNKSAEQGVVESYTLLGFMHLDGTAGAGKNGKEAEKWFLKIHTLDPKNDSFCLNLANARLQAFQYDKALQSYAKISFGSRFYKDAKRGEIVALIALDMRVQASKIVESVNFGEIEIADLFNQQAQILKKQGKMEQ